MSSRNAAVSTLLADLRDELLVAPGESHATEHVAMMRVEEQVFTPTPRRRVRSAPRRPTTRSRRIAALFAAICVLSGNVGLNAAGAVPAAFRQITDRITDTIVDTFGVPQASEPSAAGSPVGAAPATGRVSAPAPLDSAPSVTAAPPSAPPDVDARPLGAPESPALHLDDSADPPPGSEPPAGSHQPPKHNMGKDPTAPPGLPSDWRDRAVAAARTQLEACAQATDLAPAGCPQVADVGDDPAPERVQWTVLNQPLAGATAVARAVAGGGSSDAAQAVITVYGLFQMHGAYTAGDEPQARAAYSSGVAQATMTWDGSALANVSFESGSLADRLPDGVYVPAFERPDIATDEAVLAALQSGFAAWATGGGGTVVGDPTLGAVVAFDPEHGTFNVSGAYVSAAGGGTSQEYTASLVANGGIVHLLSIAGP